MKIYHVVAMANNRVIGKDNKLPWHFSSDMKFFKQLTIGNTVIMGRKTFESIGKPLPNRKNFILSSRPHPNPLPEGEGKVRDDFHFFNSIQSALTAVKTETAFIIGGSEIFKQTRDKIDGIYLTRIHADFEGDTFYPEIPPSFKGKLIEDLQDNPKIEVILYEK
jgi:dihydrofolate reductase